MNNVIVKDIFVNAIKQGTLISSKFFGKRFRAFSGLFLMCFFVAAYTGIVVAGEVEREEMKVGAWSFEIEVNQTDARRDQSQSSRVQDVFCLVEEDRNRFMVTPKDGPVDNMGGMECERQYSEGPDGSVAVTIACSGRRQSVDIQAQSTWSAAELHSVMMTDMKRGRNHIVLEVNMNGSYVGKCEDGMQRMDEAFLPAG